MYPDEDRSEFFPEQEKLADLGFNSIYWVCEILRRCLQWEINAKYDAIGGRSTSDHQMAWTSILATDDDRNHPFKIIISLSADFIWPLLIDDYSQAEKAVCSFTLASTIVHELCVSKTREHGGRLVYLFFSITNLIRSNKLTARYCICTRSVDASQLDVSKVRPLQLG